MKKFLFILLLVFLGAGSWFGYRIVFAEKVLEQEKFVEILDSDLKKNLKKTSIDFSKLNENEKFIADFYFNYLNPTQDAPQISPEEMAISFFSTDYLSLLRELNQDSCQFADEACGYTNPLFVTYQDANDLDFSESQFAISSPDSESVLVSFYLFYSERDGLDGFQKFKFKMINENGQIRVNDMIILNKADPAEAYSMKEYFRKEIEENKKNWPTPQPN